MLRTIGTLKIGKTLIRVTEMIHWHTHSIHERKIEAAEPSVLVASLGIVEYSPCLQRSTEASDLNNWNS